MAKTFATRVLAPQLAPALRAAAPFIDPDKRSHRHRINLAVHTITVKDKEERHLFVAAGNVSSAILIDAGQVEGLEYFACDITPAGAAVIVKFFGGKDASGVTLTLAGGTLRVASTDRLFDNQSLEVRTRKPGRGTDTIAAMRRILALGTPVEPETSAIAIGHLDTQRLAAVNKVLGTRTVLERMTLGDDAYALAYIGMSIAAIPAHGAVLPAWHALPESDDDGRFLMHPAMSLRHLLNETMPSTTDAPAADDACNCQDGAADANTIIDLDTPTLSVVADDEVDAA